MRIRLTVFTMMLSMIFTLITPFAVSADEEIHAVYPSDATVRQEYFKWSKTPVEKRNTPKNMNVPYRILWIVLDNELLFNNPDDVYYSKIDESYIEEVKYLMYNFEMFVEKSTSNNVDIINDYIVVDAEELNRHHFRSYAPATDYEFVMCVRQSELLNEKSKSEVYGQLVSATYFARDTGQGSAEIKYRDLGLALHEFLHNFEFFADWEDAYLPGIKMPDLHLYEQLAEENAEKSGKNIREAILGYFADYLSGNVKCVEDGFDDLYIGIYPSMWQYMVDSQAFRANRQDITQVIVPDDMTYIGRLAFLYFKNLKRVDIPNSVTAIGDAAFFRNSNLETIAIPPSVTAIGPSAFQECHKLTIYGEAGSYAETYAKEKGIKFNTGTPEKPDIMEEPAPPPVNTSGEIWVVVNGNKLEFDQPPILENGRTLVPLRAIFEALGASVQWDPENQIIIADRNGIMIKMQIGSNILRRGISDIELDVPPQLVNGRTLVPVRAVAESFNAIVLWDEETTTVTIKTN